MDDPLANLIWAWTQSCCLEVHPWRSPEESYLLARARLVYVTLRQESSLVARRQNTVTNPAGMIGGNGLGSVEPVSVHNSLDLLRRKPLLRRRAAAWLFPKRAFRVPMPGDWYEGANSKSIIWMMRVCDRTAILFTSLHYLAEPGRVPSDPTEAFSYWLCRYNRKGVLRYKTETRALREWLDLWHEALAVMGA